MFASSVELPSSDLEGALSVLLAGDPVEIGPVDVAWDEVGVAEPPVVRDDAKDPKAAWQAYAERCQDWSDDLDAAFRVADASRIGSLLVAYEASMVDLAHRFGPSFGTRDSLGAQAFFKSTGLRWRVSALRIAHLVDTAMILRDRLPKTWQVFLNGAATWQAADLAVQQAGGLDPDRWAAYDTAAAGLVATAAASRMKHRLRRERERLQDDTAEPRAKAAGARRTVRLEPAADGQAALTLYGPAVELVAFDRALTKAAIASKLTGDDRSVGVLRFDIAIDLLLEGIQQAADPDRAGISVPSRKAVTPTVILTIPVLAALGHTGEQANLAGYGPIDLATAKRLAGTATSFTRVLTDPVTGVRVGMDRSTRIPPADMRRWVITRDETCRFPGCNRPADLCDLDHVQEWQHLGVTDLDNLVALDRSDHLAKTAGLWQQELLTTGAVDWIDPWNHHFQDPPPPGADPTPPALNEWATRPDPLLDDCPF